MIEDGAVRSASRTVADPQNEFIVGPRGPFPMDDLQRLGRQAHRAHKPRITVIGGTAGYDAPIDVTDYTEIGAPAQTAKRTERPLRFVVGPLVVFAAAAVIAIMLSLTVASDGPAPVDGSLSGHGILHFPR